VQGDVDARGIWIRTTSKWVFGVPVSEMCTSAATVPPVTRMTAETAALFSAAILEIGVKSQARMMLRIGTSFPSLALAGPAAVTAGFTANAAARTTGTARRVSAGIVIDILSTVSAGRRPE
jgi:hypothetical protein